jgi:formylglycine-generating enzyme required for sulfatase activity
MRRPLGFFCLALAGSVVFALARSADVQGQPPAPAAAPCPPNMVLVAGGSATLGAPDDEDALPLATRTMGSFCIDRTEVTVAEYRACVASGACPAPETTVSFPGFGPPEPMKSQLSRFCNAPQADHADHPMNCVDQRTASLYCKWEGGRLPEEEEWEYAARGPAAARFPWGAGTPKGELCWDRRATAEGTCAVGQFPQGASPVGALDMAGNVWEWTSSRMEDGSVVRGGGWTNFLPRLVSSTYRWPLVASTRLNCLGFRCVRSLGRAAVPPRNGRFNGEGM